MRSYYKKGDIEPYFDPNYDPVIYFDDEKDVVGILGDWGTGEQDATNLLEQLVLRENANIIIHLGDVYFAGLPDDY